MNGGQPGDVIPCKTLMTRQGGGIDFNLVAQGLQTTHTAFETLLVAHRAGWRVNLDMFFHLSSIPLQALMPRHPSTLNGKGARETQTLVRWRIASDQALLPLVQLRQRTQSDWSKAAAPHGMPDSKKNFLLGKNDTQA